VIEGRITHPNDATLKASLPPPWRRIHRAEWHLDKAHRTAQIDAVVALAMALERAEQKARAGALGGLAVLGYARFES
jgi:hypothetical protein